MGTAHPGYQQCKHCWETYLKPVQRAERLDVKHRRALKRNQLSPATRSLISAVDLQEPQMRPDPPLRASRAIRDAIYDIELDRLIENKTEEEALEAVANELQKINLRDVPVVMERPPDHPEQSKPLGYRSFRDLTDLERQEISDAYAAAQPVTEIARAWNVSTYTLYQVTKAAGLDLRSAPGRKPTVWVPTEPAVLIFHDERASEMPQSTPSVSNASVEPAPTNGVVSGLTEWVVTYEVTRTETVTVAAKGFSDAASAVSREHPDVNVLSVAKVKP
jgi:hypothetical protein